MTYCIGLKLNEGLVLLADTRTNAGVDNISRYRKLYTWERLGERVIALMTAGNLSITQGVVNKLNRAIARAEQGEEIETILSAETLFRVAQIVGNAMSALQKQHRHAIREQGGGADASIIVAGQRKGGRHRLFMVYTAGNFIEATVDTPFFQLGEHKYGKPILDRIVTMNTSLPIAVKAAMVSMDSTLRSNLSVGMPLDLLVAKTDALSFAVQRRIQADDPGYQTVSRTWSAALRTAFESLPEISDAY
ncbi:MAG: peptidase [Pseudomonadota bacterium]